MEWPKKYRKPAVFLACFSTLASILFFALYFLYETQIPEEVAGEKIGAPTRERSSHIQVEDIELWTTLNVFPQLLGTLVKRNVNLALIFLIFVSVLASVFLFFTSSFADKTLISPDSDDPREPHDFDIFPHPENSRAPTILILFVPFAIASFMVLLSTKWVSQTNEDTTLLAPTGSSLLATKGSPQHLAYSGAALAVRGPVVEPYILEDDKVKSKAAPQSTVEVDEEKMQLAWSILFNIANIRDSYDIREFRSVGFSWLVTAVLTSMSPMEKFRAIFNAITSYSGVLNSLSQIDNDHVRILLESIFGVENIFALKPRQVEERAKTKDAVTLGRLEKLCNLLMAQLPSGIKPALIVKRWVESNPQRHEALARKLHNDLDKPTLENINNALVK